LAIEATVVSGWVNWRVYCTNACTSPSVTAPEEIRRAPTTATRT
jgi:hypothetical protein